MRRTLSCITSWLKKLSKEATDDLIIEKDIVSLHKLAEEALQKGHS
jgi:hypothetical protein